MVAIVRETGEGGVGGGVGEAVVGSKGGIRDLKKYALEVAHLKAHLKTQLKAPRPRAARRKAAQPRVVGRKAVGQKAEVVDPNEAPVGPTGAVDPTEVDPIATDRPGPRRPRAARPLGKASSPLP